jgi:arylsulfatase A-like enzyme
VFTSDHGDYLGDHWMGEKNLFHDCSVRVPMLVVDPSPEADATRGTVSDALVEMIDLAPTFLEWHGGKPKPHVLEGRSLLPLLRGGTTPTDWRQYAFSEFDYSARPFRSRLGIETVDCRMVMVSDGRWKMVHVPTLRPMLYDLETDPGELVDLGADPHFEAERQRLKEAIFVWLQQRRTRITVPEQPILPADHIAFKYDRTMDSGILIGYWDEADLAEEQAKRARALAEETSKPR